MPDLMNFSITKSKDVTVTVPCYLIQTDILHSQSGTGLGKIDTNFPEILQNFTDEELEAIMKDITNIFISKVLQIQDEKKIEKVEVYSDAILQKLGKPIPPTPVKISDVKVDVAKDADVIVEDIKLG